MYFNPTVSTLTSIHLTLSLDHVYPPKTPTTPVEIAYCRYIHQPGRLDALGEHRADELHIAVEDAVGRGFTVRLELQRIPALRIKHERAWGVCRCQLDLNIRCFWQWRGSTDSFLLSLMM